VGQFVQVEADDIRAALLRNEEALPQPTPHPSGAGWYSNAEPETKEARMKWVIAQDAQLDTPRLWAKPNEQKARVLRVYLASSMVELYCAILLPPFCFLATFLAFVFCFRR
jgi:hypothetical protein